MSLARRILIAGAAVVLCAATPPAPNGQPSAAPKAGAASAAPASQDPIARDYKAVCGKCHSIALMENDVRGRADWMQTLQAMIERGAVGTDDQLDNVVRYLDANLTKINMNVAGADEIGSVLDLPDAVAAAVVKRRSELVRFKTIAEIAAVPGVDAAKLKHREARILF